jgi:hypothetical protein
VQAMSAERKVTNPARVRACMASLPQLPAVS